MIVVVLIAVVALSLLIRDLLRESTAHATPAWARWARAAPFVVCAALSIWIAVRAPHGRKPFSIDFSIASEDLARSMTKLPHLVGVAVLFLLAALAFGTRRLRWAFFTVMLLGVAWEIGEGTVVRHYARLADLAPNLTGGLVSLALVATIRWFIDRQSAPTANNPPGGG